MSRRILSRFLAVLILVLTCQQVPAQALLPQSTFGERLLVLKNGNVVTGLIEQLPNNYSVQTNQGSRLIISADKVDFVCDSMEQVYWGRLTRTRASDLDGQQSLFYWCLQQEMFAQARNQLEVMQTTGTEEARLSFLRQRLERKIERQANSQQQAANQSVNETVNTRTFRPDLALTSSTIPSSESNDFFDELAPIFSPLPSMTDGLDVAITSMSPTTPIFKSIRSPADPERTEIAQVGYVEPLDSELGRTIESSPKRQKYLSPPVHELESFTRKLSPDVVNGFRQQVERNLIQHCSDCHNGQSPVMPLLHAGKLKPSNRRLTQRNLHSVMSQANQSGPEPKRFLRAAITPHGGGSESPLTESSEEFEKLKAWVNSIDPQSLTEPARFDKDQLTQSVVKPLEKQEQPTTGRQAMSRPKSDEKIKGLPPTIGEIPNLDSQPKAFQPHDEFDPEIFNRMFRDK